MNQKMNVCYGAVFGMAVLLASLRFCQAGELTVEGSLTVKTNLAVKGQLSGTTGVITNLTVAGQAVLEQAVIRSLSPGGDLSMGTYTNRAAGGK